MLFSVVLIGQSGELKWAVQMGDTLWDYGYSIALDDDGNCYTTGTFEGIADFDPGSGTYNLISAGYSNVFISKLDDAGNFVWTKKMGGNNMSKGLSIALDHNENVYTTGYFGGTADFDPGSGTYYLTSIGIYDIFISKLDVSGNFVWNCQMGGSVDNYGHSISLNDDEDIYITGYFKGNVDIDLGSGTYTLASAGYQDIIICRLIQSPSGTEETGSHSGIRLIASGNTITLNGLEDSAIAEVFDLTGKSLGQWHLDNINNEFTLNNITGIYIVRITGVDLNVTERIYLK